MGFYITGVLKSLKMVFICPSCCLPPHKDDSFSVYTEGLKLCLFSASSVTKSEEVMTVTVSCHGIVTCTVSETFIYVYWVE